MGFEIGWNCYIFFREGGYFLDDRGSSVIVLDRNIESFYDIQDDVNVFGQDGDEKYVSWKRVYIEFVEKSNGIKCFFVSWGGGVEDG